MVLSEYRNTTDEFAFVAGYLPKAAGGNKSISCQHFLEKGKYEVLIAVIKNNSG